ncbi:MAG TPA: hypothetical protein GYA07_04380 [Verrucomicrobia bacterium]|nr:hypothetical protein [Verrucomicrobiota bacterium]HOB31927.1 hypothetical protein [Verrucomicrobiota bacterium]HOP96171.1 hypothetical protein [Verrucomicrobiota bacterium]
MSFETQQRPSDEKATAGEAKAVPVNATVAIVRCNGARLMAFQDENGLWRDYFHRRTLPAEIEIVQILH